MSVPSRWQRRNPERSNGSPDRVLWQTELREGDQLRVTASTYRGTEYVSLRHYWQPEDGEWAPTKRGVTVNVELVPEIIEALERAAGEDS